MQIRLIKQFRKEKTYIMQIILFGGKLYQLQMFRLTYRLMIEVLTKSRWLIHSMMSLPVTSKGGKTIGLDCVKGDPE